MRRQKKFLEHRKATFQKTHSTIKPQGLPFFALQVHAQSPKLTSTYQLQGGGQILHRYLDMALLYLQQSPAVVGPAQGWDGEPPSERYTHTHTHTREGERFTVGVSVWFVPDGVLPGCGAF